MDGLGGSQSSPDLLAKPNFRSCGRLAQKIQPAHAGTVRQPNPVPTIPSRIETTLYKGRRERKGFGSHSLRFSTDPGSGIDPDGPAPGQYGQQKSFHEEVNEREGWGIRGTGGFASRSRRFGARSLPTLPTYGRGAPGPGLYESTSVINKLKNRSDFLQAKATAVFADPAPEAISAKLRSWAPPMPGPGQYKMPDRKDNINGAVAAFKCMSKRGEAGPEQGDNPGSIPGPGAYYSQKPILPPTGSGHDGPNAIFKEAYPHHFSKVHPDLPMADPKARQALGDFAHVVAKECRGDLPSDLPGPGKYNQDRDAMWEGRDTGIHGMSSFLPGPQRTDFGGGQESASKPGPGQYDAKLEMKLKLTSAKSAFVSASEQHPFADLLKGPGPCFYKPPALSLNPKSSFHLNSKKRFL